MTDVVLFAEGFKNIAKQLNALDLATNTEDILDTGEHFQPHQLKTRFLRHEATDGST